MRYELLIGWRYLRAKRTEKFVSLITVISMLGVTIGVMTLTVVLAVMTGFEEDLRDRILGFTAHITVTGVAGGIGGAEELASRIAAVPGVIDAAPFVSGQAMVAVEQSVAGATIRGVTLASEQVLDLARRLKSGRISDLPVAHDVPLREGRGGTVKLSGIILGKDLARQLGVLIGDPVTVISPLAMPTAIGLMPRVKRFVVIGIFDSGMAEYDSSLAYIDFASAQRFFDLGDTVTGIEVRATDLYAAQRIGSRLQATIGPDFKVRDWMQANHNLFSALALEKTVYFIVLLLIVLVAAFNIVATLTMVVMEKRKDIAILKSMGATRASIARIFIFKGMIVGLVGVLTGNLAGYLTCWALRRFQFIELPKDVFYVNTLPVQIYPEYFAAVTLASLVICMVATVYPARQASRLSPVAVIRYE